MSWNSDALNALERELEVRVKEGCARGKADEERESAEVLGYWMYRLKECKETE